MNDHSDYVSKAQHDNALKALELSESSPDNMLLSKLEDDLWECKKELKSARRKATSSEKKSRHWENRARKAEETNKTLKEAVKSLEESIRSLERTIAEIKSNTEESLFIPDSLPADSLSRHLLRRRL